MSNPNSPAGGIVYIRFTTNDAAGGAVAPSTAFEAADVKLYKDNSSTERTSQAGWTMTSPFDTITGLHTLAIDTSDNTDAGFYAEDHDYFAVLSPDETVDGQTVVSVIGEFFIGPVIADVIEWNSTDVATPDTAGYPKVTIKDGTGTGEIDTTSGGVLVAAIANNAITANAIASDAITAAKIAADAITSSELATSAIDEIVDAVWDEVNTGATHNIANSTGRQLRQISGQSIALFIGTAQAGAASTITLSAGATSVTNAFVGCTIVITGGTGLFQVRRIIAYNGTTKVATVDRTWGTNPDNTSTFAIYANSNPIISDEGTAQAGGASTITLRAGASATDDIYINAFVTILSGTGSGQTRIISDYVGATKVATVDSAWDTQPDNTSIYAVIPNAQQSPQDNVYTGPSVAEIWSQAMTELASVPGVSGTVLAALSWCFTLARNKRTQTEDTETVYKDDGSTTLATSTKSDTGALFTRGEYS